MSGSVSELVAKWLSTTGIDPTRLIDTTDVEFDQLQLSVDPLQSNDALEEATSVEVSQQEQTKLLSLSVEIGDEAKVNTTAEACILGKIHLRELTLLCRVFGDSNLSPFSADKIILLKRHFPYSLTSSVLLANLCWEFAMSWNKDITQLESLAAALTVLRQIPMKNLRHGKERLHNFSQPNTFKTYL